MSTNRVELVEALSEMADLMTDREVLHALTSHLTAREVMVIARLLDAAGQDAAFRRVMEGIIHGDDEVRALAAPMVDGAGTVRVEYFNRFLDSGVEEPPIYVRTFDRGGIRNAMEELNLTVDIDHLDWAAVEVPGLVVLDSAIRN